MGWKLQTIDQSVQPSPMAYWDYPSKEAALYAACELIANQRLVKVLSIENADHRMELEEIEKWCRDYRSKNG